MRPARTPGRRPPPFARPVIPIDPGPAAVSVATIAGILAAVALVVAATGFRALVAPVGALLVAPLLLRPRAAVALAVIATVLAERSGFGALAFTRHLYEEVKGVTPLDGLVVLAVAAVALDVARNRRTPHVPALLGGALFLLFLAMLGGGVTAYATGSSLRTVVLSERVYAYVLLLPVAVVNLDLDERASDLALKGAFLLAAVKAAAGIAVVVTGRGLRIDGAAHLSYYEPTANWLVMLAALGLLGLAVMRERPPLWTLVPGALMLTSLLLSYRRSFWIATVLAALLVVLLGLSPAGRRLLVPAALLATIAVWALGSVHFQAQTPLVERASSLSPERVSTNAQDRYRFDERANVLAEIRRHPVSGLGVMGRWRATERPLGVEHPDGRRYVHFAALFYWLDMGILGLCAYLALLAAVAALAWRAWRAGTTATGRAFGLASLCGLVGLAVMETTATFTGVDPRFTVLFAAQIGLLATIGHPAAARR